MRKISIFMLLGMFLGGSLYIALSGSDYQFHTTFHNDNIMNTSQNLKSRNHIQDISQSRRLKLLKYEYQDL